MKNITLQLDKNKGLPLARAYFMDICGLYKRENINPKHIDDSLRALEDIYDRIQIKAIFSAYDRQSFQGDLLVCDDVTFRCRALSRVAGQDVLGVFMYLLTIGEINQACERVLYQVYYDMWMTAFVDVGRDLLKKHIAASLTYSKFAISDSFGPGFFGMPASDTKKFFQILNAKKIGVTVRPNGSMEPVKTYAGFYLVTTEEKYLPSKDCESCYSTRKTCSYCKTGRQPGPAAELEFIKGDLSEKRSRPAVV